MQDRPIPDVLNELTALRFVAAVLVIFVHIPGALAGHPAVPDLLVRLGHYGVDLFFVLSGFILLHAYGGRGGTRFLPFMQNRLARVMPLHLFLCAVFVLVFGLGRGLYGPVTANGVVWESLPWHLLGLHSAGMLDAHAWNYPSWSVSAEIIAYCTFSLVLVAARRVPAPLLLAAGIAAMAVTDRLLAQRGADLFYLTYNGGAIRALLGFWIGAGLYGVFRLWRPDARIAGCGALAVGALIGAAVWAQMPGTMIVGLMAALIYLCASMGCGARASVLRSPLLIWLGERSFAFYMVHLLAIQIMFHLYWMAGLTWYHWSSVALSLALTVALSDLLYRFVEIRARRRFRVGGPGLRGLLAPVVRGRA